MEEKKLNKVDSPEQLNEYIRLSNPGAWIIMIGFALLLAGFCVWIAFGIIETKIETVAVSDNLSTCLYVKEDDMPKIKAGMPVRLKDVEDTFEIAAFDQTPVKVTEELDEYIRYMGNLHIGEWAYKCTLDKTINGGIYGADIIIESISSMKFIVN